MLVEEDTLTRTQEKEKPERKEARHPKPFQGKDLLQAERFERALRHALAETGLSHRKLCDPHLGITVGSFSKYLRREVHPYDVAFEVQFNLAKVLGLTVDALYSYYESGEYETDLTFDKVNHWLRESISKEDLPRLMESLSVATKRVSNLPDDVLVAEPKVEPYTWPIEELKGYETSDRMRERLTLTDDRLKALATDGTFDDDLVEGFSMACNYDMESVREAFTNRKPV